MLYQIFIYPIELIFEMIYFLLDKTISNTGISIVGMSIAVQLLTLPLYNRAEKWQAVERKTQQKLKPKVDKIKAVFKGDEQYMILSTFYKQQGYHPLYALRSSFGLLVQVPFFIAAYTYLSNLPVLQGASFYFIKDLGAPDALFTIGTFSINILPIAMTLINIVSSMLYTKGFALREKVQLYVMAGLFLVLLYNSPSALVLYWTLNNVFALIKNLICKAKHPVKILYAMAVLAGIGLCLYSYIDHQPSVIRLFSVVLAVGILLLPIIMYVINKIITLFLEPAFKSSKQQNILFAFATITLFLLVGAFIPSSLMVTSPQEFSFIDNFGSPLQLIQYPFLQSVGIFLIWIPLIYMFSPKNLKVLFTWLITCGVIIVLCDTFIFTGEYSDISANLRFDNGISQMPPLLDFFIDALLILSILIVGIVLLKYVPIKITVASFGLIAFSLCVLSSYNSVVLQREFIKYEKQLASNETANGFDAVYNLSTNNKNVIIIMLDRAINSFIPYIFEENSKIEEQFSGFTYFPNTLSPAGNTLTAVPSLFGGHEYTPENINKRADQTLIGKHNEALCVLPVTFMKHGFDTTITDPPWANYSWVPDTRIFSEWEEINAQNVIKSYTQHWTKENNLDLVKQSDLLTRNLLFFSFFRIFPNSLRGAIYDNGRWWELETSNAELNRFLDSYSTLDMLPKITSVNEGKSSFIFMTNDVTHEPVYLQYPEYKPLLQVTDIGNNIWDNDYTYQHYHSNMGAIQKLGEWFDFLREKGVYDNTRIIIVSDHGAPLQNIVPFKEFNDAKDLGNVNPAYFNPLFMVKDFEENESVKTDMRFMTTPDLPYVATQGIIENAKNPFSQKEFTKNNGEFTIHTGSWNPKDHPSNILELSKDSWHVKDNIFDPENWTRIK